MVGLAVLNAPFGVALACRHRTGSSVRGLPLKLMPRLAEGAPSGAHCWSLAHNGSRAQDATRRGTSSPDKHA
eukprot:6267940-Pyramimonas_sp.AAC.1